MDVETVRQVERRLGLLIDRRLGAGDPISQVEFLIGVVKVQEELAQLLDDY